MTAKSQTSLAPDLLRNRQYSGTVATLLYNWPIFVGLLLFGIVGLGTGAFIDIPWRWMLLGGGFLGLILALNILIASFFVYDWGYTREYDRLAELSGISAANVVIDITCGKLRGSRGLLSRLKHSHYFVIDIYDPQKMTDYALRRARKMEPPLESQQRIYRRTAKPDSLPIPHNWADVVYCSFSLHELDDAKDRADIFKEFARILKPGGKLLIAEHDRDWRNLLAFGPGVFSFTKSAVWEEHIGQCGLTVKHRERWRGLVHLWVAERKARD